MGKREGFAEAGFGKGERRVYGDGGGMSRGESIQLMSRCRWEVFVRCLMLVVASGDSSDFSRLQNRPTYTSKISLTSAVMALMKHIVAQNWFFQSDNLRLI